MQLLQEHGHVLWKKQCILPPFCFKYVLVMHILIPLLYQIISTRKISKLAIAKLFFFFSFNEYLPPEFVSFAKKIEKDILLQYKLLTGVSPKRAKLRYLQFTKELKSYGYTFFSAEVLFFLSKYFFF